MTQPNDKTPQPNKAAQTPKKGAAVWIVSGILLLAGVFVANYVVQQAGETPSPVVSAEEEHPVDAETIIEAEPAPVSELVVTSDVRGADVYLNNKHVGKTPHKQTPLQEGRYRVKVEKAGYETFEKDVEIDAAMSHTLRADLKPAAATETSAAVAEDAGADSVETPPVDVVALNESVSVKHKHRIRGGCEGLLRASGGEIRFETDHKDAFSVALASVERFKLDKDNLNVKIRDGKNYNFVELDEDQAALALFFERVSAVLPPDGE